MLKLCQQLKKIVYWTLGLGIGAGIIVFIYSAYHYQWQWTGFVETKTTTTAIEIKKDKKEKIEIAPISKQQYSEKTLWDWLELSSSLLVPILIFSFGLLIQKRREKEQKEQADLEEEIAQDNLNQVAIQNYLKSMADILLDEELAKKLFNEELVNEEPDKNNPVRDAARALTVAILRRLEGDQTSQTIIIHFLRHAKLYQFIFQHTNLWEINLSKGYLKEANLQGVNLRKANLQGAYLRKANLQEARLNSANLEKANLTGANLTRANLRGANLRGANLTDATYKWKEIKSACNWKEAIYKSKKLNREEKTWETIEKENTNYINELNRNKSSEPKEKPDCSFWEEK